MLTKVTVELTPNAELYEQLGYSRHEKLSKGNNRHRYSSETIRTQALSRSLLKRTKTVYIV